MNDREIADVAMRAARVLAQATVEAEDVAGYVAEKGAELWTLLTVIAEYVRDQQSDPTVPSGEAEQLFDEGGDYVIAVVADLFRRHGYGDLVEPA